MVDPEHVKGIFGKYAQLRQGRASREDAWGRIKATVEAFDETDRKRLMALIRDWEIIEGHRYQANRSDDPHATMFKPPEGLKEAREQLKTQRDPDATTEKPAVKLPQTGTLPQTGKLDEDVAARRAMEVICPQCSTLNDLHAIQCKQCGAMLPQTQEIERPDPEQLPADPQSQVLRGMVLKLEVTGAGQALRVPLDQDQLVLGRASTAGLMAPDIDLTPFDAQRKGVSRYHANLKCEGDTLVINDLESLNHTYINGLRLYPHETRVLRNGDELKLGQLIMRVFFVTQEN